MSMFKFLLLLIPLVATSTQGFLIKKGHTEETTNADGSYLENIKAIAEDVKDALSSKKQAVIDGVSAIGNTKLNIIHNIKDSKKNLIESILASQIAKVNAMKAAKEEFVKSLMGQKQPLYFLQNKLHKIKEAVPTLPPVEGLKTRLFNFFLEFFNKFQGHFQKHKKFAFVSHPSSSGFPQVQGIATSAEDSEPQINFFPTEALPIEVSFPVTPTSSPSSEYVQPVQPAYEFDQIEDVQSGFQQSQFSPALNYDGTKDDFVPPSDSSAVDFTDQQVYPHVPSPYYGIYPPSVKSARAATYRTPN